MRRQRPLMISPYYFLSRRPFREARIRAYIRREHRSGRRLEEILDDRAIERLGGRNLAWQTILRPDTIVGLEADIAEAIEACDPHHEAPARSRNGTP